MKAKLILFYGYLIILAADLMSIHAHWLSGEMLFKSLLMPLLIAYYISISRYKKRMSFKVIIVALVLAWAGDVFLLFGGRNELYFVLGMTAFLLMQAIYALTFYWLKAGKSTVLNSNFIRSRIIMVIVATGACYYVIAPKMGALIIPIGAYVLTLTIMVIFAVKRRGFTTDKSFTLIYSGSLIFMISDGIIAINKFLHPINHGGILIMLTYGIAQLLIIRGIYMHQKAYISSK